MEPPHPPGKRSLWELVGNPITILLSIILIFTALFLIFVVLTKEPYDYDYYHLTAPTGALSVQYNISTDTYRLCVISLSDEIVELDEIYFNLNNDKIEIEHSLPAVLDNEFSNITLYDIDDNGIYSVGDEFHIDGEIVEPGTNLYVVWSRNGKYIMGIDFGE